MHVIFRGKISHASRPVCLMVTPCHSADSANVEHPNHEGYARAAVVAYWRHMPTALRHEILRDEMCKDLRAVDPVFRGASQFREPARHPGGPESDVFLGIEDLQWKFQDAARGNGWAMAMMEMLVDPMLSEGVPEWVVEQYERGNPCFRSVLNRLKKREVRELKSNRSVLARTRREMIRRHQAQKRRKH